MQKKDSTLAVEMYEDEDMRTMKYMKVMMEVMMDGDQENMHQLSIEANGKKI